MPRRSNDFQRLVFDIYSQLYEHATVTESAMVPDRRGGPKREIDILIEDKSREFPIVIGVECMDRGRPADTTWVEQQAGKHEGRTDKLVLVSRNGFADPALEEARRRGVICLTLADAASLSWPALIEQLRGITVGTFNFIPLQGYFIVEERRKPKAYKAQPHYEIFDPDGNALNTLDEFVSFSIRNPDFGIYFMEKIRAQPDLKWGVVENDTKKEVYVHRPDGTRHKLLAIRFDLSWTVNYSDMTLQAKALGSTAVAWGSTQTPDGGLSFVATEQESGGSKASLRLSSADGKDVQIARLLDVSNYEPSRLRIIEASPEDFLCKPGNI